MTVGRALYLKTLCLGKVLQKYKNIPNSREPPCSPALCIVEPGDTHTKAKVWSSYCPASSAPASSCESHSPEPLGTALQISWISCWGPGKSWPVCWLYEQLEQGCRLSSLGHWHAETATGQAACLSQQSTFYVWKPSLPTAQRAKLGDL